MSNRYYYPKRRHVWTGWKRLERCSRPGCRALRKFPNIQGANSRPAYSNSGGKVWTKTRPICTGGPTTDKGA